MDVRLKSIFIVVAILAGVNHFQEWQSLQADIRAGKKRFVPISELSKGGPKPCFDGLGNYKCGDGAEASRAPAQAPVESANRAPASSEPWRNEPLTESRTHCRALASNGQPADPKSLLSFIRATNRGVEPILVAYEIARKYGRGSSRSLVQLAKDETLPAMVRYIAMLASLKCDYAGTRDQIHSLTRSSDDLISRAARLALQEVRASLLPECRP